MGRLTCAIIALALATPCAAQDFAAYNVILAHRQANYAKEHWNCIYYIDNNAFPVVAQEMESAVAYAVAASSWQEAIELCTPQRVAGAPGITFIDLRSLYWDYKQFAKVVEKYPYHRHTKYVGGLPLIIRADWLLAQLIDTTKSDAHYRLLYNDANIDRNGFIKFWGGNLDVNVHYGVAEGNSGVSANSGGPNKGKPKRWVLNLGNNRRTYLWGTLDFFVIDAKTDPLNNPTYPFVGRFAKALHDGEEWIAGIPKYSIKSGEFGAINAYLITDRNGKRVESAPGELVVQLASHPCRGYASITNNGGCMACHEAGLNNTTENEYITLSKLGERKFYDKGLELKTNRFNQRSPLVDVRQNNELYAIGIKLCNGYGGKDNAANVFAMLREYDAAVTVEQFAWEIGIPTQELQLSMGWHGYTVKYDALGLNARFTMLSGGGVIPRTTAESIYTASNESVLRWHAANKPKVQRPALPSVIGK